MIIARIVLTITQLAWGPPARGCGASLNRTLCYRRASMHAVVAGQVHVQEHPVRFAAARSSRA
jgi:hypothetical protein